MREASVGHQCPECVAEGRRTVRRATTAFGGSPVGQQGYVTIALVALNIAAALIGVLMGGPSRCSVGSSPMPARSRRTAR